jgi:hypothetical protein
MFVFSFRLEMYTKNRGDLHATHGSTFVYAWWFFLSSAIVADTSYWHIFQVARKNVVIDAQKIKVLRDIFSQAGAKPMCDHELQRQRCKT